MRVVQLIDELGFGGAEKLVVGLSTDLARRGHTVKLVCLREIGSDPVDLSELQAAGGEVVALHKPGGLHLPTLFRFASCLREFRADVVHTHNHLVHHYGSIAGRMAGVPAIISTLHGSASLRTSAKWSQALYWLSGMVGSRVVSVCEEIDTILRDALYFPVRKLSIVDNGVDLASYLQIPPRVPRTALVFGTMGRLEAVKDHRNLLQAFALLRRKHQHVRLRILGDGSLRGELQDLARQLDISEQVRFEGFSLDTPGFLGDLDVFVISSLSEGLPLSLLEAMGSGLPVVATAVGAVPQIVRSADCGWCAPPGNAEALAAAMEQAVNEADIRTIGARGRSRARDYYSVDRMTSDYESLYAELRRGSHLMAETGNGV